MDDRRTTLASVVEGNVFEPDPVRTDDSLGQRSQSRSPSPSKKGRKSVLGSATPNKQNIAYADLQSLYTELLQKYRDELKAKSNAQQDSKRKEELYIRRETRFRDQIQALQHKIDQMTVAHGSRTDSQESIEKIRYMHSAIQENIELLQDRTTQVLKDQEKDLLRAFKTRMCDVNEELERERRKNESGASEWVQRCHKLTEELEWMKDMTYRLEAQNKQLQKENRQLKTQIKTQEDDRDFLINQILVVKKENTRLREQLSGDAAAPETGSPSPSRTTAAATPIPSRVATPAPIPKKIVPTRGANRLIKKRYT